MLGWVVIAVQSWQYGAKGTTLVHVETRQWLVMLFMMVVVIMMIVRWSWL